MVNRQRVALAVLSAFSLFPIASYGGSGGSPTAPAAGKGTDYCCTVWTPAREGSLTVFTGTGCVAIIGGDEPTDRNMCQGTVAKCRGEFYTPTATTPPPEGSPYLGRVDRCLTP